MERLRQADQLAGRLSGEFEAALLGVDPARAYEVARRALSRGLELAAVYEDVIAPALWKVGELWEEGAISVADEHLATAMTYRIMVGLYASTLGGETGGGRVLLAGVEGEQHVVGLRMAADVLEVAGFETTYLGADVPTHDLLRMIKELDPDLLAISATMPFSAYPLRRAVAEVRAVHPSLGIVVGGQGAATHDDDERTVFVSDLDQLLETAKAMIPAGAEERERSQVGFREMLLPFGIALEDEDALTRYLSTIAGDTADLARSLARQAITYRDLAYTDPLTGLPNRRAFEDRVAEPRPGSEPVALLMVDVDSFKAINDSRGHEAGDRVLARVAKALTDTAREGDFIARFGGDEFAALLPATGIADAHRLAERLRQAVEASDPEDPVTVSIGVTTIEGDDLRRALLQADSALYEAKNSGRNATR
jgi:MerR family transcriptional regulator, light-induced transcriptional regulator